MRIDGWDVRLAECVEQARSKPFEWGQHDCTIWAMSVRAALTGGGEADWAGKYKTAIGATRHLRRLGFETLEGAGKSVLGEPIAPLMAQRGDICLTPDPEAPAEWPEVFGVCLGAVVGVVTPDGLRSHPLRMSRLAWRV